jgi:SAM-dependent methyltransferase
VSGTIELRRKVHDAYSDAARYPEQKHAFPTGRAFAESLGYPAELLGELPPECSEAFSGVSAVSLSAEMPAHGVILDLGCGAGLDSLIAARRAGPGSRLIGIDFSVPMLTRARDSMRAAGVGNMIVCQADAERLPLSDSAVDVAMVNGIFNLNPGRDAIFRELGRVMKPGGSVFAAELVLKEPLPADERSSESNWFA